ncbi:sugar ABC transporter permease [Bacillus ginsengihumi]|uniref:Sugar ABC transporter permease n=1 Tax=Heyndrickxia ginsengihumi TaxID=363870 RepID=A0A6M0PA18_9BACI|nr:sugar ABC transporter permease [Heyndrickxia ginsengihumi]NEY20789.1 sugar ABC transporter permease [Heyndrickxia ginsengihumi]
MNARLKSLGAYWNRPNHAAYLFILPSFLILILFVFVPLIGTFILGFFDINIFFTNTKYVGLENFITFFHDSRALNAFKNTLYFTILETPVQVVVGLIMAALLAKNTVFNKFSRSIYFIPVVCSLTSIGIIWSMLLDPNIGAIPYLLSKFGMPTPQFFRDPHQAMPTIVALTVWKNFGVTMMILMAGIQGISQSYYESAEIDGATKFQQFYKITIPQILPSLGFCILTNLIGSLQVFDQVYITTNGGPEFKTETAVQYIYSRGFSAPYQLGYASAISAILFILIAILAISTNYYLNRKEKQLG